MEYHRQLLWNHGWVIGKVFSSGKVSSAEIDTFIRGGSSGSSSAEPRLQGVDEKVAEILRTGKVRFG